MIRILNNNEWVDMNVNSIRELKEQLNIDYITNVDKVASKIAFNIDIWGFIDPKDTTKFLTYSTKKDTEHEYMWMIKKQNDGE